MVDNSPFGFIPVADVRSRLLESGDRIERAYSELFSGYALTAEDVLNETIQVDSYSGNVIIDHINFYTFCEHHFLPFFGQASVTYTPNKIITGIGKVVRLVRDVHSRRLQIQETMARDICDDMMRVLDAKGVRVVLRARHLCMCSRGPLDDTAETEVIYEAGSLHL